jgi:hypothetical protein
MRPAPPPRAPRLPAARRAGLAVATAARVGAHVAAAGAVSACGRDPVAPASAAGVDPAWVTGAAARALDPASGLFVLPDPTPRVVSRPAAESVAVGVARFYGSPGLLGNARAALVEQRGAPIAFDALRPCGRATYVRNGHGEPPPGTPGWVRRGLSPQWAVPLCVPGTLETQLSVGVPDGPRDLGTVGTTLVGWREFGGGHDFTVVGVPARFPAGLPLPPEAAVAYAVRVTGRRVAAVPVGYDVAGPNYPLCAGWQLTLEAPVRLVGDSTGRAYETTTVYVRPPGACYAAGARLYVPLADQPAATLTLVPRDTARRMDPLVLDTLAVPVVGPRQFERATPVPTTAGGAGA